MVLADSRCCFRGRAVTWGMLVALGAWRGGETLISLGPSARRRLEIAQPGTAWDLRFGAEMIQLVIDWIPPATVIFLVIESLVTIISQDEMYLRVTGHDRCSLSLANQTGHADAAADSE